MRNRFKSLLISLILGLALGVCILNGLKKYMPVEPERPMITVISLEKQHWSEKSVSIPEPSATVNLMI